MTPILDPVARLLAEREVVVLDGGLGSELEARGNSMADALWSSRLLQENPTAIRDVHAAYFAAGADCVTSASYQATVEGLRGLGLDEVEAAALLQGSVELAVEARAGREGLVAASVGPYGAFLADGSEFTGDYDLDEDGLYEWHRARFALLAASGADLLACETLPSFAEARALARLLSETPAVHAWFSFACRDGAHISDGTSLAECAAWLDRIDRVAAVGVNCTAPRHVEALIGAARARTSKPIVVYPNAGKCWDAQAKVWRGSGDDADFVESARRWRKAGAALIGGCCGVGPATIEAIHAALT